MTLTMSTGTAFIIHDDGTVVAVCVPRQQGETSDETYASFTHVLTDENDFSDHSSFFST